MTREVSHVWWLIMIEPPHQMAHNEPPYLDLHCWPSSLLILNMMI